MALIVLHKRLQRFCWKVIIFSS